LIVVILDMSAPSSLIRVEGETHGRRIKFLRLRLQRSRLRVRPPRP
jgi:hypothetical protein